MEKGYNNWINELSPNTNLRSYLDNLQANVLYDDTYQLYKDNIKKTDTEENPFLTVLIRTQGKREEGLREAFLCLSGQTNDDFEIILVGHKVEEKRKQIIKDIIDDQQDEFKSKIRYIELDEGTRTAPLNLGFSLAKGKYIAVFDDDDILFDNWVESFYECSKENSGKILHSYAFAQNWKELKGLGYRAETKPVGEYCQNFELLSQFIVNKCPLMTLAFPTNAFQKLGITFNEKLNVMEDWEYFMRVARICGVADTEEPTAIYRFWQNLETSATLHDQEDWNKTYERIQDGFADNGIILGKKEFSKLIEYEKKDQTRIIAQTGKDQAVLYYSKGATFNEQMKITADNQESYPQFDHWFILEEKSNQMKGLRFDLCDEGLFLLEDIHIDLWFTNGEKKEVDIKDCVHTGIPSSDKLLFLFEDPEIVWELNDERQLDVVHIYGKISRNIARSSLKLRLFENIFTLRYLFKKRAFHKKGWF
ncbi:MAG: glycosyltransferase family A protein [Lachnospiraceae bacterium]|nr:glycosyltransferase family A protein [Lachnospiraceae bacterium]